MKIITANGKRTMRIGHAELLRASLMYAFAKDAPLNATVWRSQQKGVLEWARRIVDDALRGTAMSAMDSFSSIVNKIVNEDGYRIGQTEYGYVWSDSDSPDKFRESLKHYFQSLESVFYYIGEGEVKKALSSLKLAEYYVEGLNRYRKGFIQARDAGYATLREYVEEGYSLTPRDLTDFTSASRIANKWFNDFSRVESMVKSVSETLDTLVDWGGSKGPSDRDKIDKLYHTTVAADAIGENGFKSDAEIKGLGGETEGMISTTLSKKVAIGIANAIKKMISLANGDSGMGTIVSWAKKAKLWDELKASGVDSARTLERVSRLVGEDEAIRMIDKGYVPVYPYGITMPKENELPEGAIAIETMQFGTHPVVTSYWIKDGERHDSLLKWFYQALLGLMDTAGKGYDPLFFSVDLKNFRGMDRANVGIFELDVNMSDERIKYVPGMYEYRIPTDAIKSTKRIG